MKMFKNIKEGIDKLIKDELKKINKDTFITTICESFELESEEGILDAPNIFKDHFLKIEVDKDYVVNVEFDLVNLNLSKEELIRLLAEYFEVEISDDDIKILSGIDISYLKDNIKNEKVAKELGLKFVEGNSSKINVIDFVCNIETFLTEDICKQLKSCS